MVDKGAVAVVGDARWFLLLYTYIYFLQRNLSLASSKYLKVLSVAVIIVGVVSFLQFFWGVDITRKRDILAQFGAFYRASGFFNHPLTFAYSIGMVGLISGSFSLYFLKNKQRDLLALLVHASTLASAVGLVVCLSRGAWAAGLVAGLGLVFLVRRKWAYGAAVAAVAAGVVLYFTNSTIQARFQSLTTIEKNESNRLRTVLWRANWEIFKDYPLVGVGLSKNRDYLKDYYSKMNIEGETIVSHAHNNYLQILAGTGILGFVFYMGFCGMFLIKSFRLWSYFSDDRWFLKYLSLGIFGAQVFFHLGGLTQCNFTDGEVNHQLVFLWGLLVAMDKKFKASPLIQTCEADG